MPCEAYLGRVGGLAVALGVGAAIVTGWSGGLARADGSGSAGSTASATASGSPPATTKANTRQETREVADTSDAPDAAAATKRPSHHPAVRATKKKTPIPAATVGNAKRNRTSRNDDTSGGATGEQSIAARPAGKAGSVESLQIASIRPVGNTTADAQLAAHSTPKPKPLNMVGLVTQLMSGVVYAVLSSFAAGSAPDAPAEAPSVWSLLAFARREFDNAFTGLSVADVSAGTQATDQTVPPVQRTLVLTAMPAEADAILAHTTLDPNPTVVVDGHHFYLGTLGGKKVIVAMSGIGEVNATQTTEAALDHFTSGSGNSIDAVVFDGVAGGSGRTEIGDVAVPARWTMNDGTTWDAVDPGMLAAADTVTADLDSTGTIADPACRICGPLATLPLINLGREPQLFVGGDGATSDNNNGVAFPEIPLGGGIFGPQPLAAPDFSPLDFGNFFRAVVPFLMQGALSNITGFFATSSPAVDAVDQETAAAQQVADADGVPFLGIRGISDGPGSPLPLPGYPFTFLFYKQIAADNAAIVTQAFLQAWSGA